MKTSPALLLLLVTSAALAHRGDTIINTASELRDWCKDESEASIIGRGLTPHNWSASYFDEGNVLFVKGSWRIDTAKVTVECRIARGARAQYASLTVQEPEPDSE